MPDAQGVASFIGEFMKGYMGQVAQMESEKVRKVQGLMEVADQYRKMAEESPTEEGYHSAQENYQKQIAEANKLMNEKVSGIGQIMSLFGFGKKGKNGQAAAIPREWFQRPAQGADAAPAQPSTPAAMPRPAALGPEPPVDDSNLPANFRGMQQFMGSGGSPISSPGGAPGAPPAEKPAAPTNEYAGLPWMKQQMLRIQDAQRARERKDALSLETEKAEINRRFGREDFTWQQSQKQAETDRKIQAYKDSPEYKTDSEDERSRKISFIRDQIPYREPTTKTSTTITRNSTGQLVRRTTDLRTKEVINEEPYYQPSDEPIVQAIIQEAASKGVTMTPEQAEAELGKRRLQGMDLTNKAKGLGIANQAALLAARKLRTEMAQKAKAGNLTVKDAIGLAKAATSYGKSIVMSRPEAAGMDEDQLNQEAMPIAKKWIEEVGISWNKVQSLISGKPETTAQQEAMGYKGPQAQSGTPAARPGTGTILKPPK